MSTLPNVLLARFADLVDVFELPFHAEPFTLAMAWHPRNHLDPAVAWLRDLVLEASAGPASAPDANSTMYAAIRN